MYSVVSVHSSVQEKKKKKKKKGPSRAVQRTIDLPPSYFYDTIHLLFELLLYSRKSLASMVKLLDSIRLDSTRLDSTLAAIRI